MTFICRRVVSGKEFCLAMKVELSSVCSRMQDLMLLPQLPLEPTHLSYLQLLQQCLNLQPTNDIVTHLMSPIILWGSLSMLQYIPLQILVSSNPYNRFLSKYKSGIMPPKKSVRSSAPKTEDKEDKPIQKDEEFKARTSGGNSTNQLPKIQSRPRKSSQMMMRTRKPRLTPRRQGARTSLPPRRRTSQKTNLAKEPAKLGLKKVILKESIPADEYFPPTKTTNYKVYSQGGINYGMTLNQCNLQNKYNKFYILKILQNEANPNTFMFFTRWGIVGVEGQQANIPCYSFDIAIREFNRKLRDKLSGGYREVEMNYDDDKKQDAKEVKESAQGTKGGYAAAAQVQSIIFDMKMMNNQMKEISYDQQKWGRRDTTISIPRSLTISVFRRCSTSSWTLSRRSKKSSRCCSHCRASKSSPSYWTRAILVAT